MAADGSTSKLLLVAAASAAAGSLLTYVCQQRSANRQAPRQVEVAEGSSAALASSSHEEALLAQPSDPYDRSPRQGYLSWDDYFMAVAFLSAQRSKDPNKQVGACIVDRNNVICGIGYNGFPRGCSDSELPWAKKSARGDPLDTKYPYVCHAEMNAILNKNGASVAGAKVYVTMFPCNECAKLMIQAGIGEIVYHEGKDSALARSDSTVTTSSFNRDQQYAASRRLLALAGVRLRQHLFRRPVLLRLTNDAQRPAALTTVVNDSAISSRSAIEAAAAAVAPAVAAALQNGWASSGGGDGGNGAAHGSGGSDAAAVTATAAAAAAAAGGSSNSGAGAGAAHGRRRRGRRASQAAAAAAAQEKAQLAGPAEA